MYFCFSLKIHYYSERAWVPNVIFFCTVAQVKVELWAVHSTTFQNNHKINIFKLDLIAEHLYKLKIVLFSENFYCPPD